MKRVRKATIKKLIIVGIFLGVVFGLTLNIDFTEAGMLGLQPAVGVKVYTFENDVLWKGKLTTTKSLTIGTKKNKGVLNVKGIIRNSNKGKAVVVRDDLKISSDLEVQGNLSAQALQGSGIVKGDNLAAGAVTSEKIYDGTISSQDLSDGSVTTVKINDGAVTSEKIYDGTISSQDLSDGSVTTVKINDDAVTSDKVDFSGRGFVKAAGLMSSSGTLSGSPWSFNNMDGTMSGSRVSTGTYRITVPGMTTSYLVAVILDSASAGGTSYTVSTNQIEVYTFNATGTLTDTGFFFFVF